MHVCMSIVNILLKPIRYLLFVHIVPLIMHPLFSSITHSHSTASVAMFMLKRANPIFPLCFSYRPCPEAMVRLNVSALMALWLTWKSSLSCSIAPPGCVSKPVTANSPTLPAAAWSASSSLICASPCWTDGTPGTRMLSSRQPNARPRRLRLSENKSGTSSLRFSLSKQKCWKSLKPPLELSRCWQRLLRLLPSSLIRKRKVTSSQSFCSFAPVKPVCLLGKRFSILSGPLSVAKAKISASVPRVCLTAVPTKRLWNNWAYLHKQKVAAKVGVVPSERQRQVLPQSPSAVASARETLTANKHAFCSLVFVFYPLFFSLVSPRGAVPFGFVVLVEGRLPSFFYPGAVPR